MNNNKAIYNVIKKSIEDYGKPVGISDIGESAIPTPFKAIVKYKKQTIQSSDYIIQLKDQYEFIMLNNVKINDYIFWNNAYYKVTSIDSTTDGVYKAYADFKSITHSYSIEISNSNPINIQAGDKVQLNVTCKDNDVVVSNPTIDYSTNNDNINISDSGLITGSKVGASIVTCTYQNEKATININVAQADEFEIECDNITLEKGNTTQLTPICTKNGVQVSDPVITYSVADSSIATISDNGLVTGVLEGNTTINISWQGITKTINITVTDGATFKAFKFNYEEEAEFNQGQTIYTIKVVNEDGTDVDSNRTFNISIDTDSVDLGIVTSVTSNNNSISFNLPSQRTDEYFNVSAYDVNYSDNVLTQEFISKKVR